MPLCSLLVIVKNCQLVKQPPCRQRLNVQLYGLLRDPSGFVKPAETSVSMRQVRIRKAVRRVAPERLLSFFNREIEIAEHIVDISQTVSGLIFFRKQTPPDFERLRGACLIAGHLKLVLVHDRQTLALARVLPQLVRLPGIFLGAFYLSQVAIYS